MFKDNAPPPPPPPRIRLAKPLCILIALFLWLAVSASTQVNNCCSVDRQCATDDDWNKGYYAFQNNQCSAPTNSQQQQPASSPQPKSQPTPTASADVDNCCFVDRQCTTDDDWTSGYNAYQNDQCGASSQQRSTSSQPQSQTGTSEGDDNCCNVNRQCDTEDEWKSGYWAYKKDSQCPVPSQQQQRGRQQAQGQSGNQQASSSEGKRPVKITKKPGSVTVYEYEDGTQIITRPPTHEELCNAGLDDFCDDE